MLGAVLWILFPHINTSKYRFALSTALNAKGRLSNKQLFASRAQGDKASECWVLKASSCCSWKHWTWPGAKREEQQGTNVVLQSRWKTWSIPALTLNLPCFLPGECNLNPSYTFPPPTSHQSWHPMQTAFRNRVWDTREAVRVLFIIVIPGYRKAYLGAVHAFQRTSWVWVSYSIFGPGW